MHQLANHLQWYTVPQNGTPELRMLTYTRLSGRQERYTERHAKPRTSYFWKAVLTPAATMEVMERSHTLTRL